MLHTQEVIGSRPVDPIINNPKKLKYKSPVSKPGSESELTLLDCSIVLCVNRTIENSSAVFAPEDETNSRLSPCFVTTLQDVLSASGLAQSHGGASPPRNRLRRRRRQRWNC